jgi:hypothetical protein
MAPKAVAKAKAKAKAKAFAGAPRSWKTDVLQVALPVRPHSFSPLPTAFPVLDAGWPAAVPQWQVTATAGPGPELPGLGLQVAQLSTPGSTVTVSAHPSDVRITFFTEPHDPAQAHLVALNPAGPEPKRTPFSRLHYTVDWVDRGTQYSAVDPLSKALVLSLASYEEDWVVPAGGAAFPCGPLQRVSDQLGAMIKVFSSEQLRKGYQGRMECVVRAGGAVGSRKRRWQGEGSAGDAVFTHSQWEEDAWEALRYRKSCVCFAHSTGLGRTSDSKAAVLQVLFTGIVAELHREALRRSPGGVGPALHLGQDFIVVALPRAWEGILRQDAEGTKNCRVWRFRYDPGAQRPVRVARSWLTCLWNVACFAYTHCSS